MSIRVAVIEDEPEVAARICRYVMKAAPGAFIDQFATRDAALEAARRRIHYNLITLDIRLGPHEDAGLGVLLEFFASQRAPILAITGENQFVPALRAMCSKVLRKPFLEEDVVDAVTMLLRPASQLGREAGGRGRLTWNGNVIALSPTELRLVELLTQQVGTTLGYQQLKSSLAVASTDTLHVHRATATRKFREWDPTFDAIKNVRGEGYMWDERRPP